jgi:hypothetical protein
MPGTYKCFLLAAMLMLIFIGGNKHNKFDIIGVEYFSF